MDESLKSLNNFYNVLQDVFINLNKQETDEKKYIGSYCIMIPEEIIYAANAIPIRLCSGNYTSYSIGDNSVPRDACPLVKAVVGSYYSKSFPI